MRISSESTSRAVNNIETQFLSWLTHIQSLCFSAVYFSTKNTNKTLKWDATLGRLNTSFGDNFKDPFLLQWSKVMQRRKKKYIHVAAADYTLGAHVKNLNCNLETTFLGIPAPLFTEISSYNLKVCCRERLTKSSKAQVIQSSDKLIHNPLFFTFPNSFEEAQSESEKKKRGF